MRTLIVIASAAAVLTSTSFSADAAGPPRGRPLGGVNLNYYCANTFGANYKSVLIGPTAGDWRCQLTGHHYGNSGKSISVQAACGLQYGRQGLIAYATSWSNPLSWLCYQPGCNPR
jgi:hypothetical protein